MTPSLDRVDGAECPGCGCRDSAIVKAGSRWGKPFTRRTCNHCGRLFSATAPSDSTGDTAVEVVAYPVLHCPSCTSIDVRVTSTRRPLRHHVCDACGHRFKTREA